VLPFPLDDARVANYLPQSNITYPIMLTSGERSGIVSRLHYQRVLDKAAGD